ncbi:PREDICTED: uncharacterized protein LOC104823786 [Tarenaya hassleriana]|uniref:uncharacterized protein LOC104823786 n=1 Tax=Tarenaya hassleriana TaxID=28532 RepID=UPI00053C8C3B|nr:PREDICTED: uncharacterized protein LOC104823786 [Tarenaya hassleriana]
MMLLYNKQKRNQNSKGNRFLVSINVLGSAGPIRFVVKEDETVANVMVYALKSYTRERRLPVLGSDIHDFVLYSPYSAAEALKPWEMIGVTGSRNFILCKKPETGEVGESKSSTPLVTNRKTSGSWKAWLNKSLALMIPSH